MRGGQSLVDVPNRPASPYTAKRMLAATALKNAASNSTVAFSLPPAQFFTNHPFPILSLAIDFDDGNGYQPASVGQTFSVSYPEPGLKRIKLKLQAVGSVEYVCHFAFDVKGVAISTRYDEEPTAIPVPATAEHSGGVIYLFVNECNAGLTQPLIILDGLDPQAREDLGRDEESLRTWEFAVQLLAFSTEENGVLIDILESEGYDIIFLDYNNGADYIQRNARMVRDALGIINQMKADNGSTASNIMIGPSMGGPVGKYALLEMEQNGLAHEVGSFLLLDGVQRGANVPLGLQHATRHLYLLRGPWNTPMRRFIPGLAHMRNLFHEPALKQMMLHHAYSADGISPMPEHVQFFSELAAFAPPQNFEYVALSAGSIRGTGQLVQPGGTILTFSGGLRRILTDVVGGWSGFWATTVGALGVITGNTAFISTEIKALPSQGGSGLVYAGEIEIEILFAPFISSFYGAIVSGTLPFDSSPGGFMGVHRDSVSLSPQQLIHNTVCIVPTVSSLDIPIDESTLLANFEDKSSNVGVLTVLDDYSGSVQAIISTEYGPPAQENQQHNPIINSTTIDFLLHQFEVSDPLADDGTGIIDDRTYNFGHSSSGFDAASGNQIKSTRNVIDYDLSILDGGQVWVNRAGRISFTDQLSNPFNRTSSSFDVFIRKGGDLCDEAAPAVTVLVSSGGRLELGEWNDGAGIDNIGRVWVLDGATVDIGAQGEVYANKQSEFVVRDGGVALVRAGGLLSAGFGGAVRIEAGGVARVEAGGILRISQDSELIVEPGGKLVLEAGALVQLWDGEDPFGRAALRSQGLLEVQGELEFSGNGYFDFYAGHSLSLPGGIFRIEGRGYGNRFMRLRAGASLHVGAAKLQLLDGLVEYEYGSALSVAGGQALLLRMELSALSNDQTTGLLLDGASQVRVGQSAFKGLDLGVEAYDIEAASALDYLFFDTEFIGNKYGLHCSGGTTLRAWGCTFLPGAYGVQAMLLDNLEGVRLSSCRIEGYAAPSGLQDSWGAIRLQDVGEAVVSGGLIADNGVGIYCPPDKRLGHLLLRQQAEVSGNHFYGIHIAQGSREGDNHGMVTMDCARLLDNGWSGIKGKDLVLNIDAYINSGTDDPAYVRANHFQRSPQGWWFDICYTGPLAEQIDNIPATGNYWGTDNANPAGPPYHYGLHKNVCAGFPDIHPIFGPQAAAEPAGCPSPPPGGPELPHSLDCEIELGHQEQAGAAFKAALQGYRQAIGQDEGTAAARQLFEPVAGISDLERANSSDVCKHYIDVARVLADMAGGPAMRAAAASEATAAGRGKLPGQAGGAAYPLVAPNPAASSLYIEVPAPGRFFLQAVSAAGQPVLSLAAEGPSAKIDLSRWPEGLYLLDIRLADGSAAWREKVVVQR
jgi:hypothetical protein